MKKLLIGYMFLVGSFNLVAITHLTKEEFTLLTRPFFVRADLGTNILYEDIVENKNEYPQDLQIFILGNELYTNNVIYSHAMEEYFKNLEKNFIAQITTLKSNMGDDIIINFWCFVQIMDIEGKKIKLTMASYDPLAFNEYLAKVERGEAK